jgi:outer membrane protein OmpA-like peptidoglycan-associated protein
MTFRRAAALAFGLCLVGAASHAQVSAPDGPYLRLEGGWNHMSDLSGQGSSAPLSIGTSEDDGYIIGGAIGYAMEPLRFDFTFDYRNNDVSKVIVPGLAGGAGGSVYSYSGMLNGYYDIPYSLMGLTPYIGAGAGFVNVNLSSVSEGATQLVNDGDTIPALQGIAGVRYQLSPTWSVGLEYRFLEGFHPKFNSNMAGTQISTNDYRNHSLLLNLTYYFGAPAAPPPAEAAPVPAAMTPPPAPAPAQPVMKGPARNLFLVFFDFNKSTITAAGQQVLDGAAAAYQENRSVRIELTGYTDTVGTQHYNLGLSKRRADAVAAYLSKHGVPLMAMDVAWKGKEDLRVQTPDNVREPQNRRVEIILP